MKQTLLLIALFVGLLQTGKSQCFPNRHSTNFFDGWISCEKSQSPNPARGVSHFIMYDYGKAYKLGQVEIWNTNDPAHLDWGMQDVVIDYSLDGVNWYEAGQYTFPQANGLSTYEGAEGPHLNDIEAQYLLITGLSNYGGTCYGLSEIKIEGEEVIISDVEQVTELSCVGVTLYPNPFTEKVQINLAPGCTGDLLYMIYDAQGKIVSSSKTNLISGQNTTIEFGSDLPSGTYTIHLENNHQSIQRSLVKIKS